jgi:hypothetical protein
MVGKSWRVGNGWKTRSKGLGGISSPTAKNTPSKTANQTSNTSLGDLSGLKGLSEAKACGKKDLINRNFKRIQAPFKAYTKTRHVKKSLLHDIGFMRIRKTDVCGKIETTTATTSESDVRNWLDAAGTSFHKVITSEITQSQADKIKAKAKKERPSQCRGDDCKEKKEAKKKANSDKKAEQKKKKTNQTVVGKVVSYRFFTHQNKHRVGITSISSENLKRLLRKYEVTSVSSGEYKMTGPNRAETRGILSKYKDKAPDAKALKAYGIEPKRKSSGASSTKKSSTPSGGSGSRSSESGRTPANDGKKGKLLKKEVGSNTSYKVFTNDSGDKKIEITKQPCDLTKAELKKGGFKNKAGSYSAKVNWTQRREDTAKEWLNKKPAEPKPDKPKKSTADKLKNSMKDIIG